LQDFVHKPVSHLSQGQLQRARLGAVLLPDPRVLLLDEPTAGLDEETREHIFALLMRERSRRIVLLSTHIPHDVAVPVDSVARVASGTIGMDANPDNEGEPF
jgi:ABC-type multidrug transport system ATPase subunit